MRNRLWPVYPLAWLEFIRVCLNLHGSTLCGKLQVPLNQEYAKESEAVEIQTTLNLGVHEVTYRQTANELPV